MKICRKIFYACSYGDLDTVKYLISRGVNYWQEGLLLACYHGHFTLVKYIIERFGYDLLESSETWNCTSKCYNMIIYKKSIRNLLTEYGFKYHKHKADCESCRESDIEKLMDENNVQTVQDVVDILQKMGAKDVRHTFHSDYSVDMIKYKWDGVKERFLIINLSP